MEISQAKEFIESTVQNFTVAAIKKIGEGWDNYAFEINHEYIFRFPKHAEADELLRSEARYLGKAKDHLVKFSPLEIPSPDYFSETPLFLGYKKIAGLSSCHFNLGARERIALADSFAQFLKSLHSIPLAYAASWGMQEHKDDRTDPQMLLRRIEENLGKITSSLYPHDMAPFLKFARAFPKTFKRQKKSVIHGDLYARHLILNERKSLMGIIDWGDSGIGHPAIDYQCIFTFFPLEGQKIFFAIYGELDEEMTMLAKLRALLSASGMAAFGLRDNDKDLIYEGLWSLENLKGSI